MGERGKGASQRKVGCTDQSEKLSKHRNSVSRGMDFGCDMWEEQWDLVIVF